jgi:hypothetical protein
MTTKKRLGIWMDHSNANLMELTSGEMVTNTIDSGFTHQIKEHAVRSSEQHMQNTEQHMHTGYYKRLGDIIKNYQEVLLFGPTSAKDELLNMLRADHLFEKIDIKVKHADKMTENQQHAFVKEYFYSKME